MMTTITALHAPTVKFDRLPDLIAEAIDTYPALADVYETYRERANTYPGSIRLHHAYPGGWAEHVEEVIAISQFVNLGLNSPFHPHAIILAGFLHDLGKLATYEPLQKGDAPTPSGYKKIKNCWQHMSPEVWTFLECSRLGLQTPLDVANAVLFAEGGWSEDARCSGRHGDRGPNGLGVIIHTGDSVSASLLGKKLRV